MLSFYSFRSLLLPGLAALSLTFVTVASAATHVVASLEDLQERIAAAIAGDTIVVKNGTYATTTAIVVNRVGAATAPITIAAETVGGVEIAGTHGFAVKSPAAHVTIQGFKLTHASGRNHIEVGTSHVRFTRNTFQCVGDGAYLTVAGDDAQVDRNEFRDKSTVGNMIDVRGANGQVARRLWIHHNYFHDFAAAGANGAETIRFGLSGLSMSMGHGLVEHNLFVRCVGENELISNKSGGNTYRYNTFLDSPRAQLTLRHGNECVVYGNYLRNTDGLRFFGDRHVIHSNYFEGNTLGINVGNGGAEVADGAPLTSHDRPDDCVVAFNTLIDNQVHYRMTRRTPTALGAVNTTFANNIIVGGGVVAQIEGPNAGAVWSGNLVWNAEDIGDLPAEGYDAIDPRLVADEHGIQRLAAESPAVDAATGSYPSVKYDMDGQIRTDPKDKGADERQSGRVTARILTAADVGPQSGR